MTDTSDPTDSGQEASGRHLLGPHVVGQRVVVRRLLRGETGPSGGPALTDVLGVCLRWSDGECVLQPEDRAAITIRIADIVSGKPVPPRPSVRHRVSVADAEAHTVSLFPGVETESLDGWTLRWESEPTGRLRKRANSCLAMVAAAEPVATALERVRGFYTDRGRTPLVQVERDSDVERDVTEQGWVPVPGGDADFLIASAAMLRRRLRGVDDSAELVEDGQGITATIGGDSVLAQGRAALSGDWLGIHDLYVDPAHRRQGLARQLVSALLDRGAEQGATTVWLHVETDNDAALALYESLGFARHHGCRYLTTPT